MRTVRSTVCFRENVRGTISGQISVQVPVQWNVGPQFRSKDSVHNFGPDFRPAGPSPGPSVPRGDQKRPQKRASGYRNAPKGTKRYPRSEAQDFSWLGPKILSSHFWHFALIGKEPIKETIHGCTARANVRIRAKQQTENAKVWVGGVGHVS